MPPDHASFCLVLHKRGGDPETEQQAAMTEYIEQNGHAPPMTFRVSFVAPGSV